MKKPPIRIATFVAVATFLGWFIVLVLKQKLRGIPVVPEKMEWGSFWLIQLWIGTGLALIAFGAVLLLKKISGSSQ